MKQSPQQTGPVLLVSSQGGHLAHLLALRTWWEGQDRLWVCPDTPDVVDRLEGERVVRSYSPTTRNLPNLLRNSVLALRLLRRERPSLLVSAGAGVAVPVLRGGLAAAHSHGVHRGLRPRRHADHDRAALRTVHHASARPVAEPAGLLSRRTARGAPPVTALVLALTGTDHHPFDRMVEWVDAAAVRHPDVRFVIQHGLTRPPSVAEGHEFLAHDRLVALLGEASVVVCHGGPGTIMDAREAGHVPLCVPRDPQLGEHVDGHQQRFAAVVGEAGVVRARLVGRRLPPASSTAPSRTPRVWGRP